MQRGTKPTHTFQLPFDTNTVKDLEIIYAQKGYLDEVKIVKNKEDCTLEKNTVAVTLTQEETLSLNHTMPVSIQLRILTNEDKALASQIIERAVLPCLNDEVLG